MIKELVPFLFGALTGLLVHGLMFAHQLPEGHEDHVRQFSQIGIEDRTTVELWAIVFTACVSAILAVKIGGYLGPKLYKFLDWWFTSHPDERPY